MKTYFSNLEKPKVPVAELTVLNPTKTKKKEVLFLIDTGFAGGLLLPLRTYLELGLNLFEEPKVRGRLATGLEVELRVSKAIVKIGNEEVLCNAYTALGVVRSLIGRQVLSKTALEYAPKEDVLVLRADP